MVESTWNNEVHLKSGAVLGGLLLEASLVPCLDHSISEDLVAAFVRVCNCF